MGLLLLVYISARLSTYLKMSICPPLGVNLAQSSTPEETVTSIVKRLAVERQTDHTGQGFLTLLTLFTVSFIYSLNHIANMKKRVG